MKRLKGFLKVLMLISIAASLTGCGNFALKKDPVKYSDISFDAFDTAIEITAFCESREDFDILAAEAKAEFLRLHRLFDIYNSYDGINNIRSINENAGKAAVKVDPEIIELLLLCRSLYDETGGRVNVAMGAVLKLWHNARAAAAYEPQNASAPDIEKLREAARHCDIDKLMIDEAAGTVYLEDGYMSLDVGAVAKGFAVEKVAQRFIAEGRDHIAINAGGNVRTIGRKPSGSWKIGIKNPDTQSDMASIASIELDDASLVTSGVYERFFIADGRRYHHIIDGESLFPEERYLSLSIICEDAGVADALSTALFNMEPDEGMAFIKAREGCEAIWVMPDLSVVYSYAP